MSSNNGHLNKSVTRRKTFTYTSPLSELSITYRIVPLRSAIDFGLGWRAKHPAPSVPLVESDVAGEKRQVANPSDPDYQRALNDYEREARDAQGDYVWRHAIVLSDAEREEIQEYRKDFGDELLDGKSDEELYATHIVCLTVDEEVELTNQIYRVSQPTPEVVNQVKSRFQDSV